MDTVKTLCNGTLGHLFELSMDTEVQQEVIDYFNEVYFYIYLKKVNKGEDVSIIKYSATLKLTINDVVVMKDTIYLDFSETNMISHACKFITSNAELLKLNAKLELIIYDSSKYIEPTELSTTVFVQPIVTDKLYLDLSSEELPNVYKCKVEPSTTYDFLELKLNDNPWRLLEGTLFNIAKVDKNSYIQVRGKKNGTYYYSNVVKYII